MRNTIRTSILMLAVMTGITGLVYPLGVTLLSRVLFHDKAEGSIARVDGRAVGSSLIGQSFTNPRYFWGRPSATSPAYNAAASTGSNLGPSNPALGDSIRARIERFRRLDPENARPVPVDLVTSSGSGLDPHISPAAALYQVPRVARLRGLDEEVVRGLTRSFVEPRTFGLLGEPRVNVLRLNLALDALAESR